MKLVVFVAGILVACGSQMAQAGAVRVDFSGTVSDVSLYDNSEALGAEVTSSVHIFTPFWGYFTYDDTVLAAASDAGIAEYDFLAPPWTLHTDLGDYSIEPATSLFSPVPPPDAGYFISVIDDDVYGDGAIVGGPGSSPSGAGANSLDYLNTQIDLFGSSTTLISSTALSGMTWELSSFDQNAQVSWTFERGTERVEVFGLLESLSLSVPEPATSVLVALAALGLRALGFRRARS